jgi:hypothetical protein
LHAYRAGERRGAQRPKQNSAPYYRVGLDQLVSSLLKNARATRFGAARAFFNKPLATDNTLKKRGNQGAGNCSVGISI